jgi:hypothetical protein
MLVSGSLIAKRPTLNLTKDESDLQRTISESDDPFIDIDRPINPTKEEKLPDYLTKSKPSLLAAALDSRESFNRTVLEITGFDLPELAAALINKRPKENIIEILARSSYLFTITLLNPKLISGILNTFGKLITPKEHHQDILHLARFQREDLENIDKFSQSLQRLRDEIKDQKFLAGIALNDEQKNSSLATAKDIEEFSKRFEANEENLKSARSLKNLAILGDSIEGALWGFMPIFNNVIIRQMLLKQKGFTGVNSGDREEFKGFKKIQKAGMALGMLSGGLVNSILLPLSNSQNNKFSKWVKGWQDLNHGIYPKLGLLLTNLALPANISRISASMSKIELFENLILLITVASSWCFGHKITTDQIAKLFNNHLKNKYNLNDDILIKQNQVNQQTPLFPDSNEIQDILKKTSHNEALQKDAIRFHTLKTGLGMTAHSGLVFAARMFMFSITKKLANH